VEPEDISPRALISPRHASVLVKEGGVVLYGKEPLNRRLSVPALRFPSISMSKRQVLADEAPGSSRA
jgi:hypothetical protein